MREWDEVRGLTAGRILTLWRESAKAAEEPLERALLCNAAVIAESFQIGSTRLNSSHTS